MNQPRRIGDYIIHRKLGAGGMGQVYEAEEALSKRRVALKVLHDDLAASVDGRQQFIKEMGILSGLDSPNIVRCLHCTEADGRLLIALEYLEGETLRARLDRVGALPWPEAVEITNAVLRALEVAHGQQPAIVHRDLKPENVMLLADDRVKVLDFGIAKVLGTGPTTQVAGTLQYMSPEHIDARPLDGRSDLFSLGLVMWEMLVGRAPYQSDSPRDLLNMLCTEPTPPLPELRPPVPTGLDRLIQQLLEKQPEDRPSSASEVLARVESCLPVAPRPSGAPASSDAPAPMHAPARQLDTVALVLDYERGKQGSSRAVTVAATVAVAALVGGVSVWLLSDEGAESNTASSSETPTKGRAEPDAPALTPPTTEATKETAPSQQPRPTPAPPEEPEVAAPLSFAGLLPERESSPGQAEIVVAASHKAGFAALCEGDNRAAFKHFARAAANDLVQWKYPYNMACAAGRAGGMEEEAQLALEAAMLRDSEATRRKARSETDFDSFRQTEWFQRLIGE